jgi:hypothetical protein
MKKPPEGGFGIAQWLGAKSKDLAFILRLFSAML